MVSRADGPGIRLLLICAVSTWSSLSGAEQPDLVARLKDRDRKTQREASASIVAQRTSLIKELVMILSAESKSKHSWGTRYEAIRLLGVLRAADDQAIDVLIDNFDFDPWREANAHRRFVYPCTSSDLKALGVQLSQVWLALVRIGKPAVKRIVRRFAEVEEERKRTFLVRVCVRIEGKEIAQRLLERSSGALRRKELGKFGGRRPE